MAMVSVVADKRQIAELDRIGGNIKRFTPKVLTRAINKVTRKHRTRITRFLSQKTGLKQVDLRKRNVTMRLANYKSFQSVLGVRSKAIPLIRMGAKGPEPSRGKGRGVSYKDPATGTRKRLPHAFIATMKNGHRGVFERLSGAPGRYDPSTSAFRFVPLSRGGDKLSGAIRIANPSKRVRAFIKSTPSGRARRLPIVEKYGPSLADVFFPEVPRVVAEAGIDLQREIETQVNVVLEQARAGTNY